MNGNFAYQKWLTLVLLTLMLATLKSFVKVIIELKKNSNNIISSFLYCLTVICHYCKFTPIILITFWGCWKWSFPHCVLHQSTPFLWTYGLDHKLCCRWFYLKHNDSLRMLNLSSLYPRWPTSILYCAVANFLQEKENRTWT